MAIIVKINLKALFEKKNKLLGKWWQFKVITKGSGWVERRDEIGKCSMFSRWLESFTENVTESFSSIIFLWALANICADSNAHRSTHRHLVEFSWQISMRKYQFHHSFRRRGLLQAKERWKMSLKYDRINVKSKNHKSFESFSFICWDFHCHDHFLFRSFTQRFFFIPGFEKKSFFYVPCNSVERAKNRFKHFANKLVLSLEVIKNKFQAYKLTEHSLENMRVLRSLTKTLKFPPRRQKSSKNVNMLTTTCILLLLFGEVNREKLWFRTMVKDGALELVGVIRRNEYFPFSCHVCASHKTP